MSLHCPVCDDVYLAQQINSLWGCLENHPYATPKGNCQTFNAQAYLWPNTTCEFCHVPPLLSSLFPIWGRNGCLWLSFATSGCSSWRFFLDCLSFLGMLIMDLTHATTSFTLCLLFQFLVAMVNVTFLFLCCFVSLFPNWARYTPTHEQAELKRLPLSLTLDSRVVDWNHREKKG